MADFTRKISQDYKRQGGIDFRFIFTTNMRKHNAKIDPAFHHR